MPPEAVALSAAPATPGPVLIVKRRPSGSSVCTTALAGIPVHETADREPAELARGHLLNRDADRARGVAGVGELHRLILDAPRHQRRQELARVPGVDRAVRLRI